MPTLVISPTCRAVKGSETGARRRTLRRIASVTLAAAASLLGTGCGTYTIEGRVLRSTFPAVMLVSADDPRLNQGQPVAGANVSVVRDPGSLGREQVGSATSDGDGRFSLAVGGWGAGATDEEWLISVGRRGFGRSESNVRLPFSPGGSRLLIFLAPGTDEGPPASRTSQEVVDEIQRYMR